MLVTFEEEIAGSTPQLQELFGRVLESACRGPVEINVICDRLHLSRKLAWQARKFAYCTDPFRAATLLPSPSGIKTILDCARRAAVDDATIARLETAVRAHDEIVQRHAGDRATLDLLAANCAADPDVSQESQFRELSFRGNSFFWGIRTRVFLSLGMFMPSSRKDGWFDYVQVRGLFGLQRLRPNVRWTFNQSVALNDDMTSMEPGRAPLNVEAAKKYQGVPVFERHCTLPLSLERRLTASGLYQDEITPGPIGQLGEEQIVTAEIMRDLAPACATEENKVAYFGVSVRIPIQTLIIDHFVHPSLFNNAQRAVCVFNEVTDQFTIDDVNKMPLTASVERLGPGHTASRLPDVPRYHELLQDLCGEIDRPLRDFVLYRSRIDFPPMPTSVMIRHDLHDRSASEAKV